jgi:hypothetical protein
MKKEFITIGRINSGNFGVKDDITFEDGQKLSNFFSHRIARRGAGYNEIYTLPLSYVEEIAHYNKSHKSSYTTFDVKEKEYRFLFAEPGIVGLNMFD